MLFTRDLIDTVEMVSETEIILENINFQPYGTLSVDKHGNACVTMKCRDLVNVVNTIAIYRGYTYPDGTHLFMFNDGTINPDIGKSEPVSYDDVYKTVEEYYESYRNLPGD